MSALVYGADGLLAKMTSDQEVVGVAVGYWDVAKSTLYRLGVKPEDMALPCDRLALEAVFNIDMRDGGVAFQSVLAELRQLDMTHMFRAVGGPAIYIAAVIGSVIVPDNVAYHARRAIEAARRRRAVEAAARVLRAARVDGDVDEALRELREIARSA